MQPDRRRIARLTGLAYLGMLPTGIAGFVVIRARLVDPESATATVTHLLADGGLARIALLCFMGIIVSQALAAVGFYALFRERHPTAAFAIAGFGLVNAAAILAGAAASWTGLELAETVGMDAATTVQALYGFETNAWRLGNLFFGLWLIPMGWAAWRTQWFHASAVLGWILMIGGGCYVVGGLLAAVPAAVALGLPDMAAMPATVGELWMIFALLIVGVREPKAPAAA